MDLKLGLALGSISLVGGHGTSASFGSQLVSEFGIANADTVALAAATAGLAFSGFIGGPLARRRVEKHGLRPDEQDLKNETEEKVERTIDSNRFLHALILIAICIGSGTIIIEASKSAGIILPTYFGAMVIAVVIRNACDLRKFELPLEEINTLGWISLSMFLAIALMSIRLWEVVDLAGMMALILLVQFIVTALFAYFIVFRATGRNYDAAALVAAVSGFGLGATPNAMANMEALFKEYGTSTAAYLAVPVVGGVLLDIVNTTMLTVFLNVL